MNNGEILVLRNVRTYAHERKKGTVEEHALTEFVQALAPLIDVYVNDAFAAAHRAHVSIIGFTKDLPSVAGRIMERELKALGKTLESPEKPCIYILGGAKADDALRISKFVLDNQIADYILTGGIAGHLFLTAKNVDLGNPNVALLEKKELLSFVQGIKELIQAYPTQIKVASDLAVDIDGQRAEITIEELPTDYPICDLGSTTIQQYIEIIRKAKSIVISGPVGIYENDQFAEGTQQILEAVASAPAFSLVGGGHTVAAVEKFGLEQKMGYISTAGGALIEFLMGEELPGVAALKKAAERSQ
jgi:phosphoglycerate kinase